MKKMEKRIVITDKALDALVYWASMGMPEYVSDSAESYFDDSLGCQVWLIEGTDYTREELTKLQRGKDLADDLRMMFSAAYKELGDVIYEDFVGKIT